jgi:cytochrome c551/c552
MKLHLIALAAALVAGFSAPALAADAPGKVLFNKNGCIACHKIEGAGGMVGPDLSKIGATKTKDFIKESILTPNKVITEKFPPNVMPQTFAKSIPAADLATLVDWLASHK